MSSVSDKGEHVKGTLTQLGYFLIIADNNGKRKDFNDLAIINRIQSFCAVCPGKMLAFVFIRFRIPW